jgi:hypothetical protein
LALLNRCLCAQPPVSGFLPHLEAMEKGIAWPFISALSQGNPLLYFFPTHNEVVPPKTRIDELSPQFSPSFTMKNEKSIYINIDKYSIFIL